MGRNRFLIFDWAEAVPSAGPGGSWSEDEDEEEVSWLKASRRFPSIAQREGQIYKPKWINYGTGTCYPTVAVSGKCYFANAVNYAMLGKIMHLCADFTSSPVYSEMSALLGALKHMQDIGQDPNSVNARQKLAFTSYGYSSTSPDKTALQDWL